MWGLLKVKTNTLLGLYREKFPQTVIINVECMGMGCIYTAWATFPCLQQGWIIQSGFVHVSASCACSLRTRRTSAPVGGLCRHISWSPLRA